MANPVYEELKQELQAKGLPKLRPPFSADESFADRVLAIQPQEMFDLPVLKPDFAAGVVCGLLLWADCLDESHNLCQEISSTTGSYWHGIMHRREPDYSNSRYWFRRVGDHPAFDSVFRRVLEALSQSPSEEAASLHHTLQSWGRWIPENFIALVEKTSTESEPLQIAQLAEIEALLDWTHEEAVNPSGV